MVAKKAIKRTEMRHLADIGGAYWLCGRSAWVVFCCTCGVRLWPVWMGLHVVSDVVWLIYMDKSNICCGESAAVREGKCGEWLVSLI